MNVYDKYYLDEQKVDDIFNNGIIVFDTSALLDIYYYSEEAQSEIFESVFCNLKDRLWIPSQVYFEFLKNKGKVQCKPYNEYENIEKKLQSKAEGGWLLQIEETCREFGKDDIKTIRGNLKTLRERTAAKSKKHPILDIDNVFDDFEQGIETLENHINSFRQEADKFNVAVENEIANQKARVKTPTDDLQQAIESYIEIGEELPYKEMFDIAQEGKIRYQENIPPGYMDSDKDGLRKYGDLFVWKEILRYAEKKDKDVLVVTNDVKPDWIDKEKKCLRFEMLKEFNSTTGKSLWQSNMKDFLYRIKELSLDTGLSTETLEEVEAVYIDFKLAEEEQRDDRKQLYTELLNGWLEEDGEYSIEGEIQENDEWRVFGKYYIYRGLNLKGKESLIMLNIVDRISYANILHAFRNLNNIRSYYKAFGKQYDCLQVILVSSKDKADKLNDMMNKKTRLRTWFNKKQVKNVILYASEGSLIYVNSNYPVG
jgi:hypothetical protein